MKSLLSLMMVFVGVVHVWGEDITVTPQTFTAAQVVGTATTSNITTQGTVTVSPGANQVTFVANSMITLAPGFTANGMTGSGFFLARINRAPTIVNVATASPNPVTGTTTNLSVLGADDGGEAALTYTWATTGTPPATVTFSANGTNAAKSSTATFTAAGNYTFQCTIKDTSNQSVTSSVTVTVNLTATSVAVTPASVTLGTLKTQQFTAVVQDQFGAAVSPQPAITWSPSSVTSGTLSSTGLFTANTTLGGPFTLSATSGGASAASGNFTVTVSNALPTVTIATTTASATEFPTSNGVMTITRTGNNTAALQVYVSNVGGTATFGNDYIFPNVMPISAPSYVVIPAYQNSVQIKIQPIDDLYEEGNETVVITIQTNANYTVGAQNTASVTIASDDVLDVTTWSVPRGGGIICRTDDEHIGTDGVTALHSYAPQAFRAYGTFNNAGYLSKEFFVQAAKNAANYSDSYTDLWRGWSPVSYSGLPASAVQRPHSSAYAINSFIVVGNFPSSSPTMSRNIRRLSGTSTEDFMSFGGSGCQFGREILAVCASGGYLYVSGTFETMDGVPAHGIARWTGTTWAPLRRSIQSTVGGLSGLDHRAGRVECMLGVGVDLYVGGRFSIADLSDASGSVPVANVAKWNGTTLKWEAMGAGLGVAGVDTVYSLTLMNGEIYAAGNKGAELLVNGVKTRGFAKWNGSSWAPWGPMDFGGIPTSVLAYGTNIYVTGSNFHTWVPSLTLANGYNQGMVRWDGSKWNLVNMGPRAMCMTILGNVLYVGGGSMQSVGTVPIFYSQGILKTGISNIPGNSFSIFGDG